MSDITSQSFMDVFDLVMQHFDPLDANATSLVNKKWFDEIQNGFYKKYPNVVSGNCGAEIEDQCSRIEFKNKVREIADRLSIRESIHPINESERNLYIFRNSLNQTSQITRLALSAAPSPQTLTLVSKLQTLTHLKALDIKFDFYTYGRCIYYFQLQLHLLTNRKRQG